MNLPKIKKLFQIIINKLILNIITDFNDIYIPSWLSINKNGSLEYGYNTTLNMDAKTVKLIVYESN